MLKKIDIKVVFLVIFTAAVVIISFIFNNDDTENKSSIRIVKNYTDFYTVDSCIYRFTTYLSEKNKENLFLVLSDNYKKKNSVTEDSVLDVFESIGDNSTFISRKMYYQELSENVVKYYVYGYLENNQIYDDGYLEKKEENEMYYIIYLDKNNMTFSVEPYDGDIFISGVEGDISETK